MKNELNIVIPDAYPVNPGDLSWDVLKEFGTVTTYEHCSDDPEMFIRRCKDAQIILINKVHFTQEIMERLPKLQYIGVMATGYNNVDTICARKRGIVVTNVPGYSTFSVAQLAIAMMLELRVNVSVQNAAVHAGRWSSAPDFTFYAASMHDLAGTTLGILGFGSIGQTVGRIATALGMKVIYHSRTAKHVDFPAEYVTMHQLFTDSDILSLHCPLTTETSKIVNAENLSEMKRHALLINTARGGLVDSPALAEALNSGKIAGAGIDVLEQEPPPADHPLLHAKNCLITPHVAWATLEARTRLLKIIVENIRAFVNHTPIHVVN